ncbi:ATP-citrate synthase alpha chain protein 3 [Zea mays]|uniref:ATP-citrate synthase alpha chain protein 3 n=1 Tax=Zea mays TaxID=4577 RepID=A0A1D6KGS6_MAIZE|nr:ATP-citrate synthase alpha chain protein 3 [Zea mays]
MLFGKPGKSGLMALNLDFDQVKEFIKERLGIERGWATLSASQSVGGIEIKENWDKVKTIFLPTEKPTTSDSCAPLIATHPLEAHRKFGDFIKGVFAVFHGFGKYFSFLEMNPFAMVNGEPYPLDIRGELDDTTAFKNFKKWGGIEFPLPFGRVLSPTESFIHELDEKVLISGLYFYLSFFPRGLSPIK